jgi:hypothetical protein
LLGLWVGQENRTCFRARFFEGGVEGRFNQLINLGVLKEVLADPASRF